ncbi:MAG: PTS fructose transporter subunit IIA [Thiobacillaceae bacterium]
MIGILLVTHGTLGDTLIDCVTHILGKPPEQVAAVNIRGHASHDDVFPAIRARLAELEQGEGVLVLADIFGATPCNCVAEALTTANVEGVAGVNLPMLVKALSYRYLTLAELSAKAVSGGVEGIFNLKDHLNTNASAVY